MGVNEVKKENLQRAYTKLPRYIDDIFLSYDFPGKIDIIYIKNDFLFPTKSITILLSTYVNYTIYRYSF